jgi:hypothetical protein
MGDLPAILDSIRESPDDQSRWLALSRWLSDNGRDDESVAVRLFWPTLRDSVTVEGKTVDETFAEVTRHATLLGKLARQVEENRRKPRDELGDWE